LASCTFCGVSTFCGAGVDGDWRRVDGYVIWARETEAACIGLDCGARRRGCGGRGLGAEGSAEEVGKERETERQTALLKFKQLEAECNAKKHLLIPEQRAYWEATTANLKRRLEA
jgi:hypothetical protein